jgi:hypothetical protein
MGTIGAKLKRAPGVPRESLDYEGARRTRKRPNPEMAKAEKAGDFGSVFGLRTSALDFGL